jgi:hypothetical protein
MTFFVTVGQKYRNDEKHPCGWHPDGFVRVEAADMSEARAKVVSRAGAQWAFVYPAEKFNFSYHPLGELEVL